LVSVLAFAVIGMHSLIADDPAHASMQPAAMASASADVSSTEYLAPVGPSCCPGDHTPAAEPPGHSSGHGHDLQHLCLAVLVAAFMLIAGRLLWRRGHPVLAHREPSPSVTRTGRDPPLALSISDLLSSLCVLRV
jgi:hypothetical protein